MNKFLFVVALTPGEALTPLRKKLFSLFLFSLKNQTYKNWEAILIGDEERIDEKIMYKKCSGRTKQEKLLFAYEFISSLSVKPDFIIRLDDDDLISPEILTYVSSLQDGFDCYADKYHLYYDIVSDSACCVQNAWLANTVIHKTEHALALYSSDLKPLMVLDHSKYWLKYYKERKIVWADGLQPVYLRLMSPTSITSGMNKMKVLYFSTEIISAYHNKISGIGDWKNRLQPPFIQYAGLLKDVWREASHRPHAPIKKYFFKKIIKWFFL